MTKKVSFLIQISGMIWMWLCLLVVQTAFWYAGQWTRPECGADKRQLYSESNRNWLVGVGEKIRGYLVNQTRFWVCFHSFSTFQPQVAAKFWQRNNAQIKGENQGQRERIKQIEDDEEETDRKRAGEKVPAFRACPLWANHRTSVSLYRRWSVEWGIDDSVWQNCFI